MKPDQERVKTLLADTVTLLCRNGLHFQRQLRVQGVLGITVDDADVFIVHINESFTEQGRGARLVDFQGPLGSNFTAQLVATLSGQQTLSNSTPVQPAGVGMVPRWQNVQNKKPETVDPQTLAAAKRSKIEPVQYTAMSLENKDSSKAKEASIQQQQVNVAQWQFDTMPKSQPEVQQTSNTANETACYNISYSGGTGTSANPTSATAASGGKRKANVYPPQAMLAMSFGGLASTADYNAATMIHSAALSQTGREISSGFTNNLSTTATGSTNKLWSDSSAANQLVTQQLQSSAEDQRLSGSVFDPLAGCAAWTVQQLMDSQSLQTIKTDDPNQQQTTLDMQQIHDLNPLGMLTYGQTEAGDGETGSVAGTDMSRSKQHRSKESRRSWTSKHKPYACRHPGCRRSYFFVHDLRRHLRQKHCGLEYNESNGQYEAAATDDAQEIKQDGDCPSSPHDSDDQSLDSEDEVSMTASCLAGQ